MGRGASDGQPKHTHRQAQYTVNFRTLFDQKYVMALDLLAEHWQQTPEISDGSQSPTPGAPRGKIGTDHIKRLDRVIGL